MAGTVWENSVSVEDPEVTPAERWALYSLYPTHHKITGSLTPDIYSTLGYQDLHNYIISKHSTPRGALDLHNFTALK
jgi:hypothetical protein